MKQRFQPKFNIKKGDQVIVIAGHDKDRTKARKVLAVYPQKSRVLVEGVNIVTKPDLQSLKGGIGKQEAPIHISNVMLWDAKAKATVRITRGRDTNYAYLTKRKIASVAKRSFSEAAEETMNIMGYNVIAKDGWVVKIDNTGNIIEKISPIPNHIAKRKTRLD